jgi:L-ornithine N5-oxygenase
MHRSSQPTRRSSRRDTQTYDVIGVGFGPSNLALAAAVQEESETLFGRPLSCLFLERRPAFGWHPGLLLAGARIQLSFLKDLVSLLNPRSRFSFLCYLQEQGRLDEFANLRNFFPTRLEFNHYYGWVADQLDHMVRYGAEVEEVAPVEGDDGEVELLRVRAHDVNTGEPVEALARNLVVATGGIPHLPGGIDIRASRRAFHTQDFLHGLEAHYADRENAWHFVVVGSGQTAAEAFQYLYTHYPNAQVTAAVRRFAYKPADDSHFVNEIFFPRMVDMLYELPADKRALVLEAHMDTNYSAVDLDLIQEIYEEMYQRKVAGDGRLKIRPFLELRGLVDHDTHTVLRFQDVVREVPVYLEADGVFLATGYVRPRRHPVLDELADHLVANGEGFEVERGYRLRSRNGFAPGIFLQGFCQDSHGLSDTLLSTLPARSVEILQSLTTAERVVETLGERAL